jgi:hypothetical protein
LLRNAADIVAIRLAERYASANHFANLSAASFRVDAPPASPDDKLAGLGVDETVDDDGLVAVAFEVARAESGGGFSIAPCGVRGLNNLPEVD